MASFDPLCQVPSRPCPEGASCSPFGIGIDQSRAQDPQGKHRYLSQKLGTQPILGIGPCCLGTGFLSTAVSSCHQVPPSGFQNRFERRPRSTIRTFIGARAIHWHVLSQFQRLRDPAVSTVGSRDGCFGQWGHFPDQRSIAPQNTSG